MSRRYLDNLRANWNGLAKLDPFWAVLSDPTKIDGGWKPDEFFATGRNEIDNALAWMSELGVTVRRSAALDFGCGPGRLTQGLAQHFDTACGVDISTDMIALAQRYDTAGRCEFQQWDRGDLGCYDSGRFDFIYSNVVLQHVRPPQTRVYLRELSRILAPGGVLVFQLPAENRRTLKGTAMRIMRTPLVQPVYNVYRRLRYGIRSQMEMHGIPEAEVRRLLASSGVRVVHVREVDVLPHWLNLQYVCVKT